MKSVVGLLLASGSAWAATHTVKVGDNGLNYDPANIVAQPGDTVDFLFVSSISHSVAQSNQNTPCQPMDGGIWSGFLQGETFSVKVGTDPIYFYCAVDSHCQLGMVGTINGNLDPYSAAAKSASSTTPPSGNGPVGGTVSSGTSGGGGGSSSPAASGASTPAGTPSTPAGTPSTPAGTSSTPAGTPSTPAGTPSSPAGTPSSPAGTPSTPAGTPSTPAESPTGTAPTKTSGVTPPLNTGAAARIEGVGIGIGVLAGLAAILAL